MGWAARWGFAILIGLALVAAVCVAWTLDPPAEIPSFALQAGPVYRLEVGAAVFVAAYLAATAFVLALDNRAFSEIGMSGVKAHDVGGPTQTEMLLGQQRSCVPFPGLSPSCRKSPSATPPGRIRSDLMTSRSNGNESDRSEEDRRWKERMDQLWKEFEEARERTERARVKLEVIEELAERGQLVGSVRSRRFPFSRG